MSEVRFLTRDEVAMAWVRIREHEVATLTRNVQKIVAAYREGTTPEEQEEKIGRALQEIHDSRGSSASARENETGGTSC